MNINLLTPINQLGFGICGQNIAYELDKAGDKVALFPIGPIDMPENRLEVIQRLRANAGFYIPSAPCLRIWHPNEMAECVGWGDRIGFPFFELDRFNARERHHLGHLTYVFVASQWARDILINHQPFIIQDERVMVVPLGVDREIFNENVPKDDLEVDCTVFVNIGKWEIRKGHDVLIRAFCKAFGPTDNVVLRMCSYNPFIGPHNDEWAKQYLGSPLGRKIRLIPRLTDQKTVSRVVLSGGDCGVFPVRAEGWNLELLECLSMGKHAIATFATAHTEFISSGNCRLIQPSGEMEAAEDGVWFHGQGHWLKWTDDMEEQLIFHMREVHSLKQTGQLLRNDAGIETAKHFTWANTAHIIGELLS